MRTGYFARATEKTHRAKFTQVHIVDNNNKPICRYKPHKTMQFLCCAWGVHLPHVECKECRKKFGKRILDKLIKGEKYNGD